MQLQHLGLRRSCPPLLPYTARIGVKQHMPGSPLGWCSGTHCRCVGGLRGSTAGRIRTLSCQLCLRGRAGRIFWRGWLSRADGCRLPSWRARWLGGRGGCMPCRRQKAHWHTCLLPAACRPRRKALLRKRYGLVSANAHAKLVHWSCLDRLHPVGLALCKYLVVCHG